MHHISGFTGQTGSAVATALLAATTKLRAFVRDPARAAPCAVKGVEIVTSDAGRPEKAFAGFEGANVLIPPGPANVDPVGGSLAAG